ncbi:MAG: pirin family protein [Nitrospirae bacterium]|nr:pirin family protein [Nitrospirota bacterium]
MSFKSLVEERTGIRSITRIVDGIRTLEGAGFDVRRPFPTRTLDHFDPFLLLDEMGPSDLGPGEAKGAPDHPHRGFETVTYVLSGEMEHRDSAGNAGKLAAGDVQWMTAGSGVIHSEMPSAAFQKTGGRMHGFQLWVNLPAKDKMMKPRYQDIPAPEIPIAKSGDGRTTVRVIAGESLGARAVIETRTPILYLHFTLLPGAKISQPVPENYNAFGLVFRGEGRLGEPARAAEDGQMVIFGANGDEVSLACAPDAGSPLECLLIGGVPLKEPVARYGPFVMNTEREIREAIDDYRSGRFGRITE